MWTRVGKQSFTFCVILSCVSLVYYLVFTNKINEYASDIKMHETRLSHLEDDFRFLNEERRRVAKGNIDISGEISDGVNVHAIRNGVPNLQSTYVQKKAQTLAPLKLSPMSDFKAFPCLFTYNALLNTKHCVRTANTALLSRDVSDIECVKFRQHVNKLICIHDPRKDRIISAFLFVTGSWEDALVDNFTRALDKHHVTDVLDLGCNIGVYTLAAAMTDRRVVSVDANVENIRLLSKSIVLNRLTKYVTLIWNAISDEYIDVSLSYYYMNVGGNSIRPVNNTLSGGEVTVQTILLDDIISIFRNKTVAIKMDVEKCELKALMGGKKFFENVNIKFIQMEIAHHRNQDSGKQIVSILESFGFYPFVSCLGDEDLTNVPIKIWSLDVCFIKKNLT